MPIWTDRHLMYIVEYQVISLYRVDRKCKRPKHRIANTVYLYTSRSIQSKCILHNSRSHPAVKSLLVCIASILSLTNISPFSQAW